jgi:hypothetical protein
MQENARIPFAEKSVPVDINSREFLIGHLHSGTIGFSVSLGMDEESGGGVCGGNQGDDKLVTDEGFAPPVLADEGEQAMFDLVLSRKEAAHLARDLEALKAFPKEEVIIADGMDAHFHRRFDKGDWSSRSWWRSWPHHGADRDHPPGLLRSIPVVASRQSCWFQPLAQRAEALSRMYVSHEPQ